MSVRITAKTTEDTLRERFAQDAKILADVSTIMAFAATAAAGEPMSLAAGIALVVKTAGAAIGASTNVLERLATSDNDPSAVIPPYDRFRVLFFVTAQRFFIEALRDIVPKAKLSSKSNPDTELSAAEKKQLREQISMHVANLSEAELSYLYCVQPLGGEVPLYDAFERWATSTLTLYGFPSPASHSVAHDSVQSARKRFHVYLASKDEEAEWMRNYLAIRSQQETASKLLGDLGDIKETLRRWTEPVEALKKNQQGAWDRYRKDLLTLPDQKETMFGEQFGVRRVFVKPEVLYHIRGAAGDAARPQPNLGALFGALLSSRASGEDLNRSAQV
jgi:hypothetical protein